VEIVGDRRAFPEGSKRWWLTARIYDTHQLMLANH
jgi:hypothetical protein